MQNNRLKIVKITATVFLFVGFIGWFIPDIGRSFRSHIELPNSEPHGIAIDKEGNIYCGSKFYGRVQKYNAIGRFICGFDTNGGMDRGSDFGFYLDEDDHLCIRVSRLINSCSKTSHELRVYNSEGKLIKTEKSTRPDKNYNYDIKNVDVDSRGNIYNFKGFFFPRVSQKTQDGVESVIIKTPFWLWFFQGTFPCFAFFFISMFVLIFFRLKNGTATTRKSYKSQNTDK